VKSSVVSRQVQRRIAQIQRQLHSLGPSRPGSISEQYNVFGQPGCPNSRSSSVVKMYFAPQESCSLHFGSSRRFGQE
jgi:hypothetical protein